MPAELTWRMAIEKVLSEAPGAMHYQKITEKIIQEGLHSNLGATPAATVSAAASMAIKNDGDGCPFQRIGRGLFIWKAKAGITQQPSTPVEEPEQEDEAQYDIIFTSSWGSICSMTGERSCTSGALRRDRWASDFTSIRPTDCRHGGIAFPGSDFFRFRNPVTWASCLSPTSAQ